MEAAREEVGKRALILLDTGIGVTLDIGIALAEEEPMDMDTTEEAELLNTMEVADEGSPA